MTGVTIKLLESDSPGFKALQRLGAAARDQSPAWEAIGENLVITTKQRFSSQTGPDGRRWPPNTQTTIIRYLQGFKGSFSKKTGKILKAGSDRASAKRPGIGESRQLATEIVRRHNATGVVVGSPMIYAGTFQFGARKGAYGKMSNGAPIPWGDIPPRPFIGLDERDETMIVDTVADFLEQTAQGRQ